MTDQEAEKPCAHAHLPNTHGICQYCKHWSVQFDTRVTHLPMQSAVDSDGVVWDPPVGAKKFVAEQSAIARARHTEPLQTRLQQLAINLRASEVTEGAALIEEALAEIHRLEDVHTKIVTLLTPKK